MYQFKLGPVEAKLFSGDNWSKAQVGICTDRGTSAEMFTGLQAGWRSDHVIAWTAPENTDDVLTIDGVTYTGRILNGLTAESSNDVAPHVITAHQLAARAIRAKKLREAQKVASAVNDIDLTGQDTQTA